MPQLKKNIAGYTDEFGRFRPIRSPQFVGSQRRKATPKDRKKYSRSKAGDNGIAAQEKATGVEFFDRLNQKEKAYKDHVEKQIRREFLGSNDEMGEGRSLVEFVRDNGGIRPTYKFGGRKNRGKRISYDAGDLAALTYKESGKRGLVSDKGKYSLDDMYKQATAAGYAVQGAWDLIDLMQKEIATGEKTFANHGWLDYRDNPAARSDLHVQQLGSRSFGVFLKTYLLKRFTTKAAAETYVRSIRSRAKGNPAGSDADAYTLTIYDRNNRVKSVNVIDARTGKAIAKYKSLAGAKRFATQKGIRLEVNPASAVRLAKAAISVFDNDLDLDVDSKDIARLKRGQKAIAKNPRPKMTESLARAAATDAANARMRKAGRKVWNRADYNFAVREFERLWLSPKINPPFAAGMFGVPKGGGGEVLIYETPDMAKPLSASQKAELKKIAEGQGFSKIRFTEVDLGHAPNFAGTLNVGRRHRNPIDPITAFAGITGGIASALQIKSMLNSPKRKAPAKRKTNGTTKAKSNPAGVRGGQRVADREFYRDLSAIEDGNARKVRAAKLHGVNAGYTKDEIDWLVNRAKLAARYKAKLNPADYKTEMRKALKNPRVRAGKKAVVRSKKANPIKVKLWKFYKGQKLATRFLGDYDLILRGEVISRTPKFVTVKVEGEKKPVRCGVSVFENSEVIYPLGKYSMAPSFHAKDGDRKANPAGRVGPWQRIEPNVWVRFNADGQTVAQIRKISASDFRVWAISGKKGGNGNIHSIATGSLTDAKSQAAKIMSKAGPSKDALDWGGVVRQANPAGRVGKKAVAGKANPNKITIRRGSIGRKKGWVFETSDGLFVSGVYKTQSEARSAALRYERTGKVEFYGTAEKRNPKPPRSRTFEKFQGRPVTTAKQMPISKHAPARVAQLGDLIELRLVGGKVIKPNPKRFKLCAANGKLWIAGGKFAKPNPKAAANEINPIAEISHVVYGTRKPHHGDNAYTHYIHKLGEESGKRPLLTVDREGFPVIRGGNYKIEARGIVD